MTPRRTAPYWLRQLDSRSVHALAGKMFRNFWEDGLSERQDWLFDQCIHELQWRRATEPDFWQKCQCQFCWTEPPHSRVAEFED